MLNEYKFSSVISLDAKTPETMMEEVDKGSTLLRDAHDYGYKHPFNIKHSDGRLIDMYCLDGLKAYYVFSAINSVRLYLRKEHLHVNYKKWMQALNLPEYGLLWHYIEENHDHVIIEFKKQDYIDFFLNRCGKAIKLSISNPQYSAATAIYCVESNYLATTISYFRYMEQAVTIDWLKAFLYASEHMSKHLALDFASIYCYYHASNLTKNSNFLYPSRENWLSCLNFDDKLRLNERIPRTQCSYDTVLTTFRGYDVTGAISVLRSEFEKSLMIGMSESLNTAVKTYIPIVEKIDLFNQKIIKNYINETK